MLIDPLPFVTENPTNPYIFKRLCNKSLTPLPESVTHYMNDPQNIEKRVNQSYRTACAILLKIENLFLILVIHTSIFGKFYINSELPFTTFSAQFLVYWMPK
jgi:hypothetical protein